MADASRRKVDSGILLHSGKNTAFSPQRVKYKPAFKREREETLLAGVDATCYKLLSQPIKSDAEETIIREKQKVKSENTLNMKESKPKTLYHVNTPYKIKKTKEPSKPILSYSQELEQFSFNTYKQRKDLLTKTIPKLAGSIELLVKKLSIGIGGMLYPQYKLYLSSTNELLIVATKIQNLKPKYLLSVEAENVREESSGYLGNLCSNLFGSFYNLHEEAEKGKERNALCLTYDFSLFKKKSARKFTVIIPKEKLYQTSSPNKADSTVDIITLHSKEPVWSDKLKAYTLDFKGKVTKPSNKNFILLRAISRGETEEESVIFGKVAADLYTLSVKWPLSVFQAFGLAIASVAYKVGCQ
eukprot:TRINITY_DN3803_c0_g1_i5.p1 TRINITY_DN3803_c0_g1~~TRINITY_DN3803_c0_g1_i5.p1  ORF type:complete len:357 (+),score=59.26 TRINITY_DN3803_c0_g1_i5:263-1333(+)